MPLYGFDLLTNNILFHSFKNMEHSNSNKNYSESDIFKMLDFFLSIKYLSCLVTMVLKKPVSFHSENQAYNEENFKPKQHFYYSKLT
jgi:hypothetical protein